MILRVSANAFLIVAAMLVSGAKLHAEHALTPMAATRELNRCLTCVRIAASRRGGAAPLAKQVRRHGDAADRRPTVTVSLPGSAPPRR